MNMSFDTFLGIVAVLSTVSGLITEKIKASLDAKKISYASNAIAGFVSVPVGIIAFALIYFYGDIAFSPKNILGMIIAGLSVWGVSMFGYDKFKQLAEQFVTYVKTAGATTGVDTTATKSDATTTDNTKSE